MDCRLIKLEVFNVKLNNLFGSLLNIPFFNSIKYLGLVITNS
jgi:hypothetical protein